jgi:TPR repeat protein
MGFMEQCGSGGPATIKLVTGGTPLAAITESAGNEAVARQVMAGCLAAASQGNMDGYFDLGVAYSTGSHGFACDLIEAHKWFNLAAVGGHAEAAQVRAEVAEDMTAREIAEAQRRAREWLRALPAGQIRAA